MANLTETEDWIDDLFRVEKDTKWVGGEDGAANAQGKTLGARTRWLKAKLLTALQNISTHEMAADPHTQYASKTYVEQLISNLVNSSPSALDTLKELADALGDDANFAATVNTAIAARMLPGDFQKASAIISSAGGTPDAITASFTPPIAALTDGMRLFVRSPSTNTTTTPTLTPNPGVIQQKGIVKGNGITLAIGDIPIRAEYQFDATLDKFVLINPATGVKPGVGAGQTGYQTVTGSRAIGTTYTNTTGRPIDVAITIQVGTTQGNGCRLLVSGSEISQFYSQSAGTGWFGSIRATVPPGATYKLENSNGSNSLAIWQEL